MAFKLTPPFPIDNTPIYHVDMEDGVLGKANNNGTIIINDKISPAKMSDVITKEMDDIDYDDKNVYWKDKVIPRSSIKEGDKNLPWEAEAYRNA